MNIQIYGRQKCFGTKAAERFFKERKIKYQFIDVDIKSMSTRELDSIISVIKDIDLFFNKKSPLYEKLNVAYIKRTEDDKKELLLENPRLLISPIVRDCDTRQCTVGNAVNIWKNWLL